MAESQQDDWADALAKMADGDVPPSEHEPAAPVEPPPKPRAAARPAPRTAVPAAEPPRPQRPAAPSLRPTAPVARLAPAPIAPSNELVVPAIEDQPIIMDDDSMIMDAPDASMFAAKRPVQLAKKIDRAALYRTIGYRQTLIPVLLTCGVLMLIFAGLRPMLGPDSALVDLPSWVPSALAVTGLVLLGFAALNMVSVKSELALREASKISS